MTTSCSNQKPCAACGMMFTPQFKRQKYHGEACRAIGKAQRNAVCKSKKVSDYVEARQALADLQRRPQPQRTVFRARSLAETPEIPAAMAARDSMLTGGAPQAGYAHAIGQVGVGI